MAQDADGGMGFYAAVFVALVEGGEAGYELVLDGLGESSARAVFVVAVGFCAPPAASVDVDGDEDIGGPVIGFVYDAGIARGLAVEVMSSNRVRLREAVRPCAPRVSGYPQGTLYPQLYPQSYPKM